MKNTTIKVKQVFYFSYILMLFSWMFESVLYIKELLPYIRYISYILAIIVIFYNYKKFSAKKVLVNIILTIIVIISTIYSKNNMILSLWLFLLACEQIDFDEMVRIDFKTKIIFTIIIVLLYLLGFTTKVEFLTYTGEIRSSLGFGNPNTFGYYMFSICADYLYIKTGKLKFSNIIILILISVFVGKASLSRTSSYLIILLAAMSTFSTIFKKIIFNKITKKIVYITFLILTIISIEIASNYNEGNRLHVALNNALSGRVIISQKYLEKYDYKLLGQEVEITNYTGTKTLYLDNAYLKLLLNSGILVYILIYSIYAKIIKKGYDMNNNLLIVTIIVYLMYGVTENAMFWLTGNVFLLYGFCEKEKIKKKVIKNEKNINNNVSCIS